MGAAGRFNKWKITMVNEPYKDTIIKKIKAKAGVDVIEGTHPYKPDNIFA